MAKDNGQLVAVRATVNLQGLHAGQRALVDPSDPYIIEALAASLLVAADDAVTEGTTPREDGVDVAPPD